MTAICIQNNIFQLDDELSENDHNLKKNYSYIDTNYADLAE